MTRFFEVNETSTHENRPEVNEDEQAEVELPVQGEEIDEQVVRYRLEIPVQWVESV